MYFLAYMQLILLLACLAVATYTDLRWHKIFNATTYAGVAAALLLAASVSVVSRDAEYSLAPTLGESLLGLVACAALMVLCYVFFPGGIGGGDVKLVALIGAYLGVYQGVEVLLWSLVLGACVALIRLVWLLGAVQLLRRLGGGLRSFAVRGGFVIVSEQERQTQVTEIFLAPCALVAVLIVRFGPATGLLVE